MSGKNDLNPQKYEIDKVAQKFFDKFKEEFLVLKEEMLNVFREQVFSIKEDLDKFNKDIRIELKKQTAEIEKNADKISRLFKIAEKQEKKIRKISENEKNINSGNKIKIFYIAGAIYLLLSFCALIFNLIMLVK